MMLEQSRLSMSAALESNLVSGSIDASLAEVDLRSRDPDRSSEGDIVIGPFAVLDFKNDPTLQKPPEPQPAALQDREDSLVPEITVPAVQSVQSTDAIMAEDVQNPSPVSIIDSLSQMDDFLHWSDLLSFSPDQAGLVTHPSLSVPNDFSFDVGNETGLLQGLSNGQEDPIGMFTPQQTSAELVSTTTDVLKDAQFLLKHFQNVVIPQITAIPFGHKSPWKMLNLPAAVVAFGDTTFLGSEGVSHARLANLYGLLACSAIELALKPPTVAAESTEHWYSIASQTYQQAKDHIQISLQHELSGSSKAKYKDQLMAANILTQYAVSGSAFMESNSWLIKADSLRSATPCTVLLD